MTPGLMAQYEDDPSEVELLWARFGRDRDPGSREQLIIHYSPLVKWVAGRVAAGMPSQVDRGDLISYGIFGLMSAIERFEPERGYKFETYAIPRIKGAVLDELRAVDWVPRSVRARLRELENAYSRLDAAGVRNPTNAELATAMDTTENYVEETLGMVSMSGLVALDQTVSGGDRETITIGDSLADPGEGVGAAYEVDEMRRLLGDTITGLPERERVVLTLYYYEGLTLMQIGEILGVTESRVSQIHTKAIVHLRARLAAAEREPPPPSRRLAS